VRRIFSALAVIAAAIAAVSASAGADDTHTYNIEMYNAFGLVQGSDVRIAGVNAGTVQDLNITPQKTARVTVELSGDFGTLGKDTKCSSEPQSLIAEYYITCEPAGPPLPDGGTIPASQVTQTVQNDLVQDTLREPFKQRFALLINEFGTALAGNAERLNEAIRLGAPAITQLHKITSILASQNQIITDLNQNSDKVISQLAARREDVVRFIQRATDTADASLARRSDLSRDFEILDDFLAQLQPTLAKLDEVARTNTPLLADLRAAAPGLNRLAVNLPAFSNASDTSLTSLGQASTVGTTALHRGADEIRLLAESGKKAPKTGEILSDFLRDLDDPRRAVEIDDRVPKDTGRSNPRPGQKDTKGYTGLEGLLNYAYYQPGALNQFDQVGHLLHFTLYYIFTGPCGQFNSGHDPNTGAPGVPAKNGGTTTNILDAADCVGWLGPNQPGINESLHLPPYDPSVCPNGTSPQAAESLCNPAGSNNKHANRHHESSSGGTQAEGNGNDNGGGGGAPDAGGGSSGDQGGGNGGPNVPGQLPSDVLDQILNLPPSAIDDLPQSVQDQLGLGGSGHSAPDHSGGGSGSGNGGGSGTGAGDGAAGDLLDFLFTTP
jgi:virulence factor Mce-like protein